MPIDIPRKYRDFRASRVVDEINFGIGGLRLFDVEEIESRQVGYSVARDGSSFCSGRKRAWNPNWLVIGNDTACGDPLILDRGDPALPILHDFHGQGRWEPTLISPSLESFGAALDEFARVAVGRSTSDERDANPVTDIERQNFLARISELNRGQGNIDFWGALLEC